uniref:Uncharacterized protein n=1 Tax=Sphaeramia orbicularis TaxID=375764 RepID=A0A673AL27_9TELE
MALDLSLSDALTDSVPQSGPESLVERDFVAQLEAETFEDQVGETVGKTDYIPLLDNDDTRKQKCVMFFPLTHKCDDLFIHYREMTREVIPQTW